MAIRTALILMLVSPAAFAFDVDHDSTGAAVAWHLAPAFVIDSGLAAQLQEPATNQAIQAAVATYSGYLPELGVTVTVGQTSGVGYDPQGTNENSISAPSEWEFDEDAIAITVVTSDSLSHALLDTDIALNTWNHVFKVLSCETPDSPFDDIQNTVTHELGHALGMAHNADDSTVVMYPTSPRGQVSKRTLTGDDQSGLQYLYGQLLKARGGAGCDSTPKASGLWSLVGLLGLFFGRGRRAAKLGVLSSALMASTAFADAGSGQVTAAPVALSGTVTVSQTESPRSGERLLHTYVELKVERCLSGDACPASVRIEVPGGSYGHIEQRVIDAPCPLKGEVLGLIIRGGPEGLIRTTRASVFHIAKGDDLVRFLGKVSALQAVPAGEARRPSTARSAP